MITIADWLIVVLFLASVYGFVLYHSSQLPGLRGERLFPGILGGLSLAASPIAAMLLFLPGEAYYFGLAGLLPLLLVWLLLPLIGWSILPGLAGKTFGSPFHYWEARFDERSARLAVTVYLVGRFLLSTVLLAAASRLISIFLGVPQFSFITALALGLLLTASATIGGPRSVIWSGMAQLAFMAAGIAATALVTVRADGGGVDRVWDLGKKFDRTWLVDPAWNPLEAGSVWTAAPFAIASLLIFLLVDEAAFVRLARVKHAPAINVAFVTVLVAVGLLGGACLYGGAGMFAFFYDHPREVPPQWVVNVDGRTRLALTDPSTRTHPLTLKTPGLLADHPTLDPTRGVPLLQWDRADHRVTSANIDELIRQRRVLRPNSQEPVESVEEIFDETEEAIDPTKLATRRPRREGLAGELILRRRATEELLPEFIRRQAPVGVSGLILAALLAAAFGTADSFLSGAARLFPYLLQSERENQDRRYIIRLGGGLTLCSSVAAVLMAEPLEWACYFAACTLAPLAATVLLGLTQRRATSLTAMLALSVGVGLATFFSIAVSWHWKRADIEIYAWHPFWTVTLSFVVTYAVGHLLGLVLGRSRSRRDMQGLVLGGGRIGAMREER